MLIWFHRYWVWVWNKDILFIGILINADKLQPNSRCMQYLKFLWPKRELFSFLNLCLLWWNQYAEHSASVLSYSSPPNCPAKLISKSVVTVVWQSGGSCHARNYFLPKFLKLARIELGKRPFNSLSMPVQFSNSGTRHHFFSQNKIHLTSSDKDLSYSHPHLKNTELICVLPLISHVPLISLVMADNF